MALNQEQGYEMTFNPVVDIQFGYELIEQMIFYENYPSYLTIKFTDPDEDPLTIVATNREELMNCLKVYW